MTKIMFLAFAFSVSFYFSAYPQHISFGVNPKVADSLGVRKQCDEAKWRLYCLYCDSIVRFKTASLNSKKLTFGELTSYFFDIDKHSDTVDIYFGFYYSDPRKETYYNHNFIGVSFCKNNKTNKRSVYISPTPAKYWEFNCDPKNCRSRYVKPLQPDVIAYIRKNKSKLNPWFYKEAVKRGVLK
jgi:hypothetical protein